jgi:hypothetical protein
VGGVDALVQHVVGGGQVDDFATRSHHGTSSGLLTRECVLEGL